MLSQALGRLLAIVEAYPDLKANQNFMALQNELTSTEDRIASARRYYNATVRDLNTKVETVPSNIIAGMFNVERAEYFEAVGEQREAPRVDFGQRDAVIPPPSGYAGGGVRSGRRLPGHAPAPGPPAPARRRRPPRAPAPPRPRPPPDRASLRGSAGPPVGGREVHRAGVAGRAAREHAGAMADAITIRGLTKAYGGPDRGRRARPRHPHRRVLRPARPERRRQDDHRRDRRGLPRPRRRRGARARHRPAGRRPRLAQPGRHRAAVDRRPGPAHPARGARQHREGLLAPRATSTTCSPRWASTTRPTPASSGSAAASGAGSTSPSASSAAPSCSSSTSRRPASTRRPGATSGT